MRARILVPLALVLATAEGTSMLMAQRSHIRAAHRMGLSTEAAMHLGAGWAGTGFDECRVIAGVDVEDDGYQYDENNAVAAKVGFMTEHNLQGIMLWRLDNDNRMKDGKPDKTGRPSYSGTDTLTRSVEEQSGCTWSPTEGWSGTPKSKCGCPVVAAYVALFNRDMRRDNLDTPAPNDGMALLEELPVEKYTRFYLSFIHTMKPDQSSKCKFQYAPGDPDHEMSEKEVRDFISIIRKRNPKAEIFFTSGLDSVAYTGCEKDAVGFADSLVDALVDYDGDGYDMDWENGIEPEVMDALFDAVRAKFDAVAAEPNGKKYGLTAAVWPSPGEQYDIAKFSADVDSINIMSYNMRLEGTVKRWLEAGHD